MRAKAERETILRFDDQERVLHLYTASPRIMRAWVRRGIVLAIAHRAGGVPTGWQGTAPVSCLRPLRRLGPDGHVRKSRLALQQGAKS
jgi:hypothetical protein